VSKCKALSTTLAALVVGLAALVLAACGRHEAKRCAEDTPCKVSAAVEQAYLAEARGLAAGLNAWRDSQLLNAGHAACDAFAAKLPPSVIVQDATDEGIPAADAQALMRAAVDRFCPAFADEVTS
jgi:hypothetical protein